jgi:RNA polymerase sigma-70 factor, ECF subfamily
LLIVSVIQSRGSIVENEQMIGRRTTEDRTRLADEDLLVRAAQGDDRAFEVLYDRHGNVAWSLAFRLLGEQGAAEDLVQEAFLAVWNGASRYSSPKGSVRTWILSIVHHRAVDRLRQGVAAKRRQEALEHVAAIEPDAPDAADVALAEVAAQEVQAALTNVPDDQLQVIRLAYYGGYTHHEIAALLSLPLGTVKSRMRLGLERVRRNLDTGLVGA